MKDELNGDKIDEFFGLKPNMYSLITFGGSEVNKAKGVEENLKHNEYLDVLSGKKVVRQKMKLVHMT